MKTEELREELINKGWREDFLEENNELLQDIATIINKQ